MYDEIILFSKEILQWKQESEKNTNLFDKKIWELIVKLLEIDPQKRISTKEARLMYKHNFDKKY